MCNNEELERRIVERHPWSLRASGHVAPGDLAARKSNVTAEDFLNERQV